MKFPTWTKPAINGAMFGAIATMAYGFTQGGWYSAGSAEAMAHQRSEVAVIEALLPICVNQSQVDPQSASKIEQLGAMRTSYEQRDFVMKVGWATLPSAGSPNRELATACAEALAKQK